MLLRLEYSYYLCVSFDTCLCSWIGDSRMMNCVFEELPVKKTLCRMQLHVLFPNYDHDLLDLCSFDASGYLHAIKMTIYS